MANKDVSYFLESYDFSIQSVKHWTITTLRLFWGTTLRRLRKFDVKTEGLL